MGVCQFGCSRWCCCTLQIVVFRYRLRQGKASRADGSGKPIRHSPVGNPSIRKLQCVPEVNSHIYSLSNHFSSAAAAFIQESNIAEGIADFRCWGRGYTETDNDILSASVAKQVGYKGISIS